MDLPAPANAPDAPAPERRATSRSRKILEAAALPRPLSNGRSISAGRRRITRFLNDNMVYAFASMWQGLDDAMLLDRLEHMLIKPETRPALSELLASADDATRDAFRRGELAAPAAPRSQQQRSFGGLASGTFTVQQLLGDMYRRIEARIRPVVLREGRRCLRANTRGFLHDAEELCLRLHDGTLLGALDTLQADALAPSFIGVEMQSALLQPVRRAARPAPEAGDGGDDGAGAGASSEHSSEHDVVELVFADSFPRLLMHGAAQFYGVRSWSEDRAGSSGEADATVRVLSLWLPPPTHKLQRAERAAIRITRSEVASAWTMPGSSSGSAESGARDSSRPSQSDTQSQSLAQSQSSEAVEAAAPASSESASAQADAAAAGPSALPPPLVPLLLLHVRSLGDDRKAAPTATEGGASPSLAFSQQPTGGYRAAARAAQYSYGRKYKPPQAAVRGAAVSAAASAAASAIGGSLRGGGSSSGVANILAARK